MHCTLQNFHWYKHATPKGLDLLAGKCHKRAMVGVDDVASNKSRVHRTSEEWDSVCVMQQLTQFISKMCKLVTFSTPPSLGHVHIYTVRLSRQSEWRSPV